MGRSIEDYLNEANDIIEKRANQAQVTAPAVPADDDIIKLADILRTQESPTVSQFEMTLFEKIAHSVAIVETLQNLEQIEKIAAFEEDCKSKGFNEGQIQEFLEKKGMAEPYKHVLPPLIAGLGGLAYGHKKGKEKGYNKALQDVQQAFSG